MRFYEQICEDSRGDDTEKLSLGVAEKGMGLRKASACWVTGFCG